MSRIGGYYSQLGLLLPGSQGSSQGNGADVACAAGSYTTIVTAAPLTILEDGIYSLYYWGALAVAFGAALPTALQVRLTGLQGTPSDIRAYPPSVFVANATLLLPVSTKRTMVGLTNNLLLAGTTITPNWAVQPTGQAVTVKAQSFFSYAAVREPDR